MVQHDDVCLAVTCHDPLGAFADGIAGSGGALVEVFDALAVNVTTETHPAITDALQALPLPVSFGEHGAGTVGIGTARREALTLGLRAGSARLLYSDLDHMLRWLSSSRSEVETSLAERDEDLLIIGRSSPSMAQGPERLRRTEELVNHVYGLAHGRSDRWDLMIAMRLMTRESALNIVAHSRETTIANDVEWPMLIESLGGTIGYFEAESIRFLARDDFGLAEDRRDGDPREWLARMVTATSHITAIVEFESVGADAGRAVDHHQAQQ